MRRIGKRDVLAAALVTVIALVAVVPAVLITRLIGVGGDGDLSNKELAHAIWLGTTIKTFVECFDNAGTRDGEPYNRVCAASDGVNKTYYILVEGKQYSIVDSRPA
jgi:hypothetical protein